MNEIIEKAYDLNKTYLATVQMYDQAVNCLKYRNVVVSSEERLYQDSKINYIDKVKYYLENHYNLKEALIEALIFGEAEKDNRFSDFLQYEHSINNIINLFEPEFNFEVVE